jgi:integrase/recombinase XerC
VEAIMGKQESGVLLYGPDNKPLAVSTQKAPVKRAYVVRYFGYPAEKKLLSLVASIKGKRAERDRMVMEIGFGLGVRVAELRRIDVGHVRNKESITILGKGNKERILPLSKHLQRQIKSYIKMKLLWKESIHDDAPLFVSQMGGRLEKRSLQEMFEKWCLRAGLIAENGKAEYTFHCMRHTCAMRLRERGYDIEQVAEWLGHSSLNSTRVYFRTSMEELTEMAESL